MYNDVDNDLPPFADTIDGEEIFLFSSTKTSSTGTSFLNEDDDEHLRHQHNVVASTSSHLSVDVDELLLNSNFLEQQNCDQSEDPLFWNCRDITDDHLNEFLPQSQLNLSNNNRGNTSNNNSNINNNNNNHTTSSANTINADSTIVAPNNITTSNNHITNTQQTQLSLDQHSQTIIPIQQIQSQPMSHHQTQQITILQTQPLSQSQPTPNQQQSQQQQQQQQQQRQQQPQHPQVTLHATPLQPQALLQAGFQNQQIIQQDQYQTKWVTFVHTNDQYQAFTTAQPQYFDKISQPLIQTDLNPNIQTSVAAIISATDQTQIQAQQHQLIHIAQPRALHIQHTAPTIQTTTPSTNINPPFQQLQTGQKLKITTPSENVSSKKETTVKQKPKEKQTRLDCPYCKRSFSKNFDLQQHMRCHTGEKPFQCIVCGRGFAQKSNVKKHMQAHKVWPEGPNNPPISNNHGNSRSRNNSASSSIGTPRDDECMQENESLQINEGSVNNNGITLGLSNDRKNDGSDLFTENRYSCSYCTFNGRTYFELKSHLTIHKREKVFKCIVSSCGKTFSGSDLQGFLDHVTSHNDLIYHCHLCSGQFYSLDEFGEHQKHHSGNQIKRTSQQSQTQSQTSMIVLNQQNNSSLRQQNQQVTTNQLQQQQNQRQYNQQTHQQNNQKSNKLYNCQPPKNNQKYFRCSKCMNRYTTQTALDHHLSISTHNFPCTECNKVFMCERYLRRHLNTHTTVQHVCSYCDKQFKTAAYLKMHSVVHTGEKPFRCNLCEAAFNRRDKLNRHKLTHETVKKYKCPFKPHIGCTKEFNRPDKLKAHVLTHSGIRPHPCDSCSRTFSRSSRLREHKKLHHGVNSNDNDNNNNSSKLDIKPVKLLDQTRNNPPPTQVKSNEIITNTGTSGIVQNSLS